MEICRVCLTTEKDVFPIDELFVINYNMLTNLNVTLLDGLPQCSCQTCSETVKSFIEFREKSITSEATLRNVICSEGVKEENEINILKLENKLIEADAFESGDKSLECGPTTIKKEIKLEEEATLDNYEIDYDEYDDDFIKDDDDEEEIRPIILKLKSTRKKSKIKKKSVKKHHLIENFTEKDTNLWYCGMCPKTFDNQTDLNTHIEVHKNCRRCELCQENLNSASQMFAHRIMHVPKKQQECHICAKKYKSCLYLEFHYRNEHIEDDDPKLSCKHCNTKYSTPKKLSGHYVQVHSDIRFICDVCSKGFHSRANLKSHIKVHSDKKSYICDLCGFKCKQSTGLRDHKIRRHSAGKVICKNCKRPFENQFEFDKHKLSCFKKSKLTLCPICGRQFNRNGSLAKHMNVHSTTPKYECKRCPAKFKTKDGLLSHLNRHDGNRTKQCEYCPAKFYTGAVLIKHRRTHTGEKPYVCKVCNKGFTANFNLKVHMKVHGEYLVVKKQEESTNVID
ncbi:unnamed protein product [Chrysodeixis includens]|uniref:Zinc finger protein n=1 Tax=Chrysodeixis includens TaxID=689277 RepID=A0A9N8L0N9_CHRIL|nr:unnamed protein product [Chrysodeixis includens]